MPRFSTLAVCAVLLASPVLVVIAQEPAPALPLQRFAGTWVGTQSWAIANPPPGARQDQPVTLTIDVDAGTLTGTLRPFLGGEDGATIIEARVVGDELHAVAVVGRPRPGTNTADTRVTAQAAPAGNAAAAPAAAGGRPAAARPAGWKDPIRVAFVLRNTGVDLNGSADVTMGEVKWTTFRYELSRKRTRY